MKPLHSILLCATLLAPAAAHAAAGQVLFALGRVEIQRNGQVLAAARGTPVEVGDTISTGPKGLAQVRMQDGALLSLRYGSTLTVEDFKVPVPAPAPAAAPAPGASVPVTGGRSVLRLLRGAFRTVTGLVGRNAGDAYSVITPVATIGIRGTDYSAAYCNGDCGGTPDGLYVGVSNGGVEVNNDAGTLVLRNDQYGYVKDPRTAPDRQLVPPAVLDAPVPPEGERDDTGAGTAREEVAADGGIAEGDTQAPDTRDAQPEGDYEIRPGAPGSYAYAGDVPSSNNNGVYVDRAGALIGFLDDRAGGTILTSIGTARNVNLGFDGNTGLRWGRWTGGTAEQGNGGTLDLTTASLHWIYAPSTVPALTITGTGTYTLVGNTNPTDSAGNTGYVADATLFANFTNQTVDSTLSVGFGDVASGGTLWQASGQGSIAGGTFDGTYASVTVNGSATGTSGAFSGFFTTAGADAAGLAYTLTDPTTTVSGVAGFELTGTGGVGGP